MQGSKKHVACNGPHMAGSTVFKSRHLQRQELRAVARSHGARLDITACSKPLSQHNANAATTTRDAAGRQCAVVSCHTTTTGGVVPASSTACLQPACWSRSGAGHRLHGVQAWASMHAHAHARTRKEALLPLQLASGGTRPVALHTRGRKQRGYFFLAHSMCWLGWLPNHEPCVARRGAGGRTIIVTCSLAASRARTRVSMWVTHGALVHVSPRRHFTHHRHQTRPDHTTCTQRTCTCTHA